MLSFSVSRSGPSFSEAATAIQQKIAVAATLAVREAGTRAQSLGRSDIQAGGLGNKFAAALRLRFYPGNGKKPSINAAAVIYSKIFYAGVFETTTTIRGNPRLWLPTENIPPRRGLHRVTPEFYTRNFGRLTYVSVPGHVPMLMGRVPKSSVSSLLPGQRLKLTKQRGKRFKSFPSQKATFVNVPMFVGLDRVTLQKRTHFESIANRERARLGEYYLKHIDTD